MGISQFEEELITQMKNSEKLTYCDPSEKKLDLVVAASYGGRWDIVNAVNKIHEKNLNFTITEDNILILCCLLPPLEILIYA